MSEKIKIDFASLDKYFRANLFNSATGCKSANLVATISDTDVENLAIFSSVVHLGSDPAIVGFIHRPIGDFGHTYKNIVSNGKYTINQVNDKMASRAHKTQEKFPKDVSEFKTCGFTPLYLDDFPAPFVQESKIAFSVNLLEIIEIKYNKTNLIIGQLVDLYCIAESIQKSGTIDFQVAGSMAVAGQDTYFKLHKTNLDS